MKVLMDGFAVVGVFVVLGAVVAGAILGHDMNRIKTETKRGMRNGK